MKKFLVSISLLGMLASCSNEKKENVSEAHSKLLVVNVLEPDFYADAHIKGSINIPFAQLSDQIMKYNKKTPIVLYCSNFMCSTSGIAAQQLKKLGFEDVHAYEGGMAEWYQLGYPTEGPATKDYLKEKQEAPTENTEDSVISAGKLKDLMSNYGLIK